MKNVLVVALCLVLTSCRPSTRLPPTITPTPFPTDTPTPAPSPTPVSQPKLGGRLVGTLATHVAEMRQAHMQWVAFSIQAARIDTASLIKAGHDSGFNVLLTVTGDKERSTDASYWSEYANVVSGMAAQGADAIEIWPEANIDRSWQPGKISGATYTQLLQAAYTAIKAANPDTLVIGGAPGPTGAEAAFPGHVVNDDHFLKDMAAAGAADYMDCVGVRFNTGTTSPSATSGSAQSGYHYSYYFGPMVDLYYGTFGGSRQLCFTELGYPSPEGYGPVAAGFGWVANTTVAQQAQWLSETAKLVADSDKVRLMIVYVVDYSGTDPLGYYAIIRPDGSCPACVSLGALVP